MTLQKRPSGIFYGWWIVSACFIYSIYIAGVVVFGFTSFFDPLVREFGWSYAQVSLAASLRGAETGLISPLLGFLVDRWGSRWLLFSGAILVGLGLIFLSTINSLGEFFLAFVVIAVGISLSSPAVVTPAASNWFRRRLGMAMGIVSAGFAFGGLVVPLLVKLIDMSGWRNTVLYLGFGALVICLPLSLVVRHRPELYGQIPDGMPAPEAHQIEHKRRETPPDNEMSTGQILKSRTFWQLTTAFTLQYVVIGAVIAHIMPFLATVNINRTTAGLFAASLPVVSVAGRLGPGWLSDRFNRRQVTLLSFLLFGVGTLLFNFVKATSLWLLVVAVIIYSVSYSSSNTLRAVLLREFFGKSRFGTAFGFLMGVLALGSILGPFIAGFIFDTWGSYEYAWWTFTAINLIALVLIAAIPPSARVRISAWKAG